MGISKNEHIAIIGGGAFGLSTAFELSQQGYANITVFEKDSDIPSRWSAANDLNKIMRVEYEDPWYTELGVEAAKKWQSPLYAPYFHRVGYLNCVSGAGTQKAFNSMEFFKAAGEAHSEVKPWISTVSTRQELRDICWQFNQGEMPGWKGYFNRYDGYVHSANALRGIYRSARSNGVRFFLGERKGAIQEIVYEGIRSSRKGVGVKTKDGKFYAASLIIVATGAGASKIIPEVGARVSAKSWSVAHVRLTDDETATLRGIPVTYARDLGFFFEPDPKTNLLKLCPMGGGFINTNPITGVSEAPEGVQRFVPPEDERKMRELLRQTLPYLADRPLVEKTLCWFADTSDSDFIIDYLPGASNTVIVLSGDSGHGFKMFPIFGSWVNNLLNAPEGRQTERRWQWRTNKQNDGLASQDDVSWRVGEVQELRDITPSAAKL